MATETSGEIPHHDSDDVVELILEDHRLFEHLLQELRNEQDYRDVPRRQMAENLVAHGGPSRRAPSSTAPDAAW